MKSAKVVKLSAYKERLATKQARIQIAKGRLNDDQLDAVCALMRKILQSGQTESVCEACDIAMSRLGYD